MNYEKYVYNVNDNVEYSKMGLDKEDQSNSTCHLSQEFHLPFIAKTKRHDMTNTKTNTLSLVDYSLTGLQLGLCRIMNGMGLFALYRVQHASGGCC